MHSLHPPHLPPPKVILKCHKEKLGLQDPSKDVMSNMIILADQRGKVG